MNFQYTVNANDEEPVMLINKHIGYDKEDGYGIMGDQFEKELLFLDSLGKKRIKVYINSIGGSVIDGMSIYNAILRSKCKVDTYCVGIAASIAGVIFQAGKKRIMADYGILMFHKAAGATSSEMYESISNSIATMVASRSGKEVEEIRNIMNLTTWVSPADETVKYQGFWDEVESSNELNKKRLSETALVDVTAAWKEGSLILNKALDTNKKIDMKKLANKLNLNSESANIEEAAIVEIEKIENKANVAVARVKELETDKETLSTSLSEMKNKVTELEGKLSAKENAEAEAKLTVVKNNADAFIKEAAKVGKIKNDEATIKAWNDKVKSESDFEDVKNLINSIQLNKPGAKITMEVENLTKTDGGSVVATEMQKLRNKFNPKN